MAVPLLVVGRSSVGARRSSVPVLGQAQPLAGADQAGVGADLGAVGGVDLPPRAGRPRPAARTAGRRAAASDHSESPRRTTTSPRAAPGRVGGAAGAGRRGRGRGPGHGWAEPGGGPVGQRQAGERSRSPPWPATRGAATPATTAAPQAASTSRRVRPACAAGRPGRRTRPTVVAVVTSQQADRRRPAGPRRTRRPAGPRSCRCQVAGRARVAAAPPASQPARPPARRWRPATPPGTGPSMRSPETSPNLSFASVCIIQSIFTTGVNGLCTG